MERRFVGAAKPRQVQVGDWSRNPGRDNRDVERVKDASDIVRIVGEAVALKPRGREFVGLCPFHDDHSPSMTVVPAKGIYHCFVCGAGGDVLTFVQKFHKMEFREALEFLASRAGITLTPQRAVAPSGEPTRRELLDANAEALRFFRQVLVHAELGRAAREVIQRRGISLEMVEKFQLGAAPEGWDRFQQWATRKGMPQRTLITAGLLKARDGGDGAYDVLRNRLIFPIHNKAGQPIAFGGRKIRDEDEPKYLNSPETPLFDKSGTLYALHHATPAIQRERTAIICEGYTDVIACHQAGFTNAVATLGTALTVQHARELRLRCDTVVLLFDGDEAGQRAADRAVPVFFSEPLDVRIATLKRFTDAKDPDELLKRPDGADVFRAALAGAQELLEYRFARVRDRLAGAGMAAMEKGLSEELSQLASMGLANANPLRKALVERRLSEITGLDEATIRRAMPQGRAATKAAPRQDDAAAAEETLRLRSASLSASEHLLGCILCEGELLATLDVDQRDLIAPEAYGSSLLKAIAQIISEALHAGVRPDLSGVLARADRPEVQAGAVALASRIDVETDRDSQRLRAHWEECLKRARADRSVVEVKRDVSAAEAAQTLAALRSRRADLSADRRVLPRPGR